MMFNPGVNESCWCGSGRKYKKCHLYRSTQPRLTIEDQLKAGNQKYLSNQYCLHAGASLGFCKGNIVKAHSIQKAKLQTIAKKGIVYAPKADFAILKKNNGIIQIEKIGINKASTFTGFCEKHDNNTFEAIEKFEFVGSQEQVFLFTYRAICRELYLKQVEFSDKNFKRSVDSGTDLEKQLFIQSYFSDYEIGIEGSIRELSKLKIEYEEMLRHNDYSKMNFYILWIDQIPEFLCSGIFNPEYDFQGKVIQNLTDVDEIWKNISFTITTTNNKGAVIFGWRGKNEVNEKLITSLQRVENGDFANAICRLTFEHIENVFISPAWWENLSEKAKQKLKYRLTSDLRPDMQRTKNALVNDGLNLMNWKISNQEYLIYEKTCYSGQLENV